MDKAPDAFSVWIKTKLDAKGWGIREAARNMELSHPTISSMVTYGEQPSFYTCRALAKAFDVPVEEILRLAGLLPKPASWSPERDEWNHLFDQVPDDQRETLIAMAKTLVSQGKRHAKKT